jgi:hypothetical protein
MHAHFEHHTDLFCASAWGPLSLEVMSFAFGVCARFAGFSRQACNHCSRTGLPTPIYANGVGRTQNPELHPPITMRIFLWQNNENQGPLHNEKI